MSDCATLAHLLCVNIANVRRVTGVWREVLGGFEGVSQDSCRSYATLSFQINIGWTAQHSTIARCPSHCFLFPPNRQAFHADVANTRTPKESQRRKRPSASNT